MSRSRRTLLNNLCRELESRGILDDDRGCGNVQKGNDPYGVQELFVAAQRDGIRLSNSGRRLVNVSKTSSRLGREKNYGLTDLVDEDVRWAAENNPAALLSSGPTLNQIFGPPAAPLVSLSTLFQPSVQPSIPLTSQASFLAPSAGPTFVPPAPLASSPAPPAPPSPSLLSVPPPPPPPPSPLSLPPLSSSSPPSPPPLPSSSSPPPLSSAPPPPPPPPSDATQPKKTPPPSSSSKKAPPPTVKSPPSNLELLSKLQVLKKVDQPTENKPPAAPSNPQEVMLAELRKKAAAAKERRGSSTEESNKAEEARQKARQSAETLFQKKVVSSDLESVIKRRTSLGGFESDLKRTYSLEAVKAQCEEFTDEDSCEAKHCSWEEGDEDWDEGSGCKAYEPPEWLISDRDIFALQDNYDDVTYVDIVEDHAKEWTQAIENELNLVSHAWRQEGLKGGKPVPLSDSELANVAIWDIWEKQGETNARFKALRKALENYDQTSWSFPLFIDKILTQVDPGYDWYQCVDRIDCSAQVLYRIASNQIWDTMENEIEQEAAKRKQLLAAGQEQLVQTVGQEAATQAATELKLAENRLSELQESGAKLTGDLTAARTAKSELESQLVTALANKNNATVLEIESGLKTYDKLIDQFSQQLTEVESTISSLLGN